MTRVDVAGRRAARAACADPWQVVRTSAPAATPDARGGVGALVAASTELGLRLSSWLDRLNEQNTPGICRAK